MSDDQEILGEAWRLRNVSAAALAVAEERMRRSVQAASVAQLVAAIETFSPARSSGPEWTRTFEPLAERLWAWRDDATMAALAATFRAKGPPWLAVTNAFSVEHGVHVRASLRQPAWARLPAFALS